MKVPIRCLALLCLCVLSLNAWAQSKPNVLVIMGDDVGIPNISAYSHGMCLGWRLARC